MSVSVELQNFIVATLRGDVSVGDICGDRVYDNIPSNEVFPYISFGPSDFISDDADCIDGRQETVQLDIWSQKQGSLVEAKNLTDAVKSALHDAEGDLGVNALVGLRVPSARVVRDPDGKTARGIISVEALVEEN